MTLSDKTQHQLDAEYRNNTEAVQANSAWINAHEAYAAEFGGRALCSVIYGGVTVWIEADSIGDEVKVNITKPVRMICYKPVYEVAYQGFVLNVVEK